MSILSRRSKGQAMVITILAMPALIAALALGCDMAVMYANWVNLQRAADAAVLAGGSTLPTTNTSQAADDVRSYLTKNGVNTGTEILSGPTFTTTAVPNDTVSVTLRRNVPHLFGRVVGINNADVQVTATAWAQPSSSVGQGVVPIALTGTQPFGTVVPLYGSGQNDVLDSSHWGGLILPGMNGGNQLPTAIQNGYQSTASTGMQGTIDTGLQNGPIKAAIQARWDAGVALDGTNGYSGTWDHHSAGDPRDMIIPIVSGGVAPGNGSVVTIDSFVHVWLSGPPTGNGNGNGNPLQIAGIMFMGAADVNPSGAPVPANSNIFQVVLIN